MISPRPPDPTLFNPVASKPCSRGPTPILGYSIVEILYSLGLTLVLLIVTDTDVAKTSVPGVF